jgi:hypothetical protein
MGLRTRVRSAIHAGSLSISTGKEFFDDRRFLDLQKVKDTAGRRHLLLVMEVATPRVHFAGRAETRANASQATDGLCRTSQPA